MRSAIVASSRVRAAGGFSPLALTGLLGWYDASDLGSITASGGAVSQLNDLSGNGRNLTQEISARSPTTGLITINSRNVLSFDGGDFLAAASVADWAPLHHPGWTSIATVTRLANTANNRWAFGTTPNDGRGVEWCYLTATNAYRWSVRAGVSTFPASLEGIPGVATTPTLIVLSTNPEGPSADRCLLRINGAPVSVVNARTDSATLLHPDNPLILGNREPVTANGWLGEIAEWFAWSDNTGVAEVESYMITKWGIA